MLKIGVIGTPGGWSSEKLADTVARLTGFRLLIDLQQVVFDFSQSKAMYKETNLFELDAMIIKKVGARYSPDLLDRLESLRFLYARGIKMFSSPEKILRVLDRLSCTVTLQINQIPMPKTVITEDIQGAIHTVEAYGDAIFKPLYSTKAKGMIVIQNGSNVREQVEEFQKTNPIMYIQKRIDHKGKDLGISFLNGNYLATYARCSDGSSWNTTTRSGGKYEPYEPSAEAIALAKRAQDLFNLDFTCVDVAETDQGPVVFEVSAFGGFKGLETACHIDAAEKFTEYVIREISK
ncbi:MAG: GAK system ATP-grasp enzyme [Desulfobacterales bacterium]|nr:GAK system ATP-grasp enzyme [Desulfobacterales bacterium]